MAAYIAQNVNDNSLQNGIVIMQNQTATLSFFDDDGNPAHILHATQVSLDGGTTMLGFNLLGFGAVDGDTAHTAAFVEVILPNGQTDAYAIDMDYDGDGIANLPNGNTDLEVIDLTSLPPVCFARGTRIRVPGGEKRIEDLRAGDLVKTLDGGMQPLLWVGYRTHAAVGDNAPVRFAMGVIGNDRTLVVSQQHRILLRGWESELYFGQPETLIAARHMVNGEGIKVTEGGTVDYFHLLLADHHLVWGNGILSESYFPGHALQEDLSTFRGVSGDPENLPRDQWEKARVVRRELKGYEATALAAA